jgi:hypothetical protein
MAVGPLTLIYRPEIYRDRYQNCSFKCYEYFNNSNTYCGHFEIWRHTPTMFKLRFNNVVIKLKLNNSRIISLDIIQIISERKVCS